MFDEYEKTKKVFDKIFKTREYTLYLQQAIMIDLVNNKPVAMRDYNYTNDMYIPNPHFHEFNCWGANEANLIEAISNRDYTIIMGMTIFIGAMIIVCNLLVDIISAVVDPRIKLSK